MSVAPRKEEAGSSRKSPNAQLSELGEAMNDSRQLADEAAAVALMMDAYVDQNDPVDSRVLSAVASYFIRVTDRLSNDLCTYVARVESVLVVK
jgi:hypothetical protein